MKPKRILAGVITAVLLVSVFFFSRPDAPPEDAPVDAAPKGPAPEDGVHRMFAAAERGDVESYLDCFTGRERRRLERELADQSREDYGHSLRNALTELKGRAVFAPDEEAQKRDQVALAVERVYATRTERQIYHLRRESGQWLIESVEPAQSYQPAKAYGTPVFEMPEEG
ncbi:MAG: hypothetical protein ACC628_20055 [Pirellulaceae bacterium]